jgi:hypothetical protein
VPIPRAITEQLPRKSTSWRWRGGRNIALAEPSGPRSRCLSPTPRQCSFHLEEIYGRVAEGARAVLLRDRAPWHTNPKLDGPRNITPIFLRSRTAELNPVENAWQYLRGNWLSDLVFETYDNIIDAACDAWRKLIDQPEPITSLRMREWAHVGQTP